MRDIKFKVWCEHLAHMCSWEEVRTGFNIQVLNEGANFLPLQYTELKDKNKNEIYDSDYLRYKDEAGVSRVGIVTWCSFEWAIVAIDGDDEGNQDLEMHPDYSEDWEIIGNKYQTSAPSL